MRYTRRKNRSKRKLGKKGRSKKRRSYKKLRYLRGGVGNNFGTPVPGTPINMNYTTPSPFGNNKNSNYSPMTPINFGQTFENEARRAARRARREEIRANRNTTGNPVTLSPDSVTTTVLSQEESDSGSDSD
jgi:hypothetical protein